MKRFRVRRRRRGAEEPGPRGAERGGGRAPVWPAGTAVAWERLLRLLFESRDRDLSLWRILDLLGAGTDAADLLREQIAFLEREGILVHHRRGRVALHSRDRLAVGRVSIPASSRAVGRHWGAAGAFGFVGTPDPGGDLYLPSRGLAGARHGDLVLARAAASPRTGRTQGSVVAILERAPTAFVGEVVAADGRLRVRPRDERTGIERTLAGAEGERERLESEEGHRRRTAASPGARAGAAGRPEPPAPRPGDIVLAEAIPDTLAGARVVEVIGPGEDPAVAERMVRVALGLPGAFPEEVEREAEAAAKPLTEDDLRAREDFRGAATITIDPADARDHDDAVSAEPLPGGGIRLWVHIADVAHHVRPGTALDREAAARGTSVYFPGSVIPMIPHALSSGACSLQEGQDRLVQSVGIDYTREASVAAVRFADGVVRSAARLTYEEAAAVMASPGALRGRGEGGGKAAFLLALLAPLARRLTEARIARGALDLDLPEVEFDPGKEGLGEALRARGRTDAHRLIEEFMLAANEAVARRLAGSGVPALYRVHEPPDRAEVEEVEAILEPLGVRRKGGRSLAARLQHALARFRGRPEEPIVAKVVLRAMKLARYAAGRADHFGLALSHYTHFTSPIRRYPDLVVHRMLRGLRGGGGADPLPDAERLGAVAAEASRLERRAEEAERAVDELLTAHHMRARLGEVFEGRVSGVVKTGLFVALEGKGLPAGMIEGFAPAARAARHVLTEPVRARLEEVDLLRGRLRLSLVEG